MAGELISTTQLAVISTTLGIPWAVSAVLWLRKQQTSHILQARNPKVVFIIGFYCYISCVVELLQLLSKEGFCLTEYFNRGSMMPFECLPLLIRAAQYILTMSPEFRKKYGRFKSHELALRICLVYGALNTLIFVLFFWVLVDYPTSAYYQACHMQQDALYPGVSAVVYLFGGTVLTKKLRRENDAYRVALETRWWFYMAFSTAIPCLALASANGTIMEVSTWRLSGVFMILCQAGTWLLLVVNPLWVEHQLGKQVVRKYGKLNPLQRVQAITFRPRSTTFTAPAATGNTRHEEVSEPRKNIIIEDLLDDVNTEEFLHAFAKDRFSEELTRFLAVAHRYRAKMAAAATSPRGTPAGAGAGAGVGAGSGRQLYLSTVADFLRPNAPWELNLEEAELARAAALREEGAWARASPRTRAQALDEAYRLVVALFNENFRKRKAVYAASFPAGEEGQQEEEIGFEDGAEYY